MEKKRIKTLPLGFTLVEILVALGVMSIVIFLIASYIRSTSRQSHGVTQKNDFNALVSTIQSAISSVEGCRNALVPQPPNPPLILAVPAPAPPGNTAIDQNISIRIGNTNYGTLAGNTSQYGTVSILRLRLTDRAAFAGRQLVTLELQIDKAITGEVQGANLSTKGFQILFNTDDPLNPNRVTGCTAAVEQFWTRKNASDIVYVQGNVGIGAGAALPQTALHVEGTVQADAYMYNSDARLKENIREIPNALDRVLKLQGVMYDWKNREDYREHANQLGLLAQEVEDIFPEAVSSNSKSGLKAVAYGNLIAPMIEAIKEQQKIILKQQQEIAKIKKELRKK